MIDPRNGSRWGIKPSGTNITADIHDIIDNAKEFIVVCGYNFSPFNHPTSIIPRLIARRIAGAHILLIMPPNMWGFGNTNHTLNIQYLINNGVGVILNSNNHSKWIITDFGYYYGSLNFTAASMTTKVEVVSICNTISRPGIPWWMNQTKQELLQFAIDELNHFNSVTAIKNSGAVNIAALTTLRRVFGLILKYNPEIEKVQTTLLNYEDVRIQLSSIIDEYFPVVSLEDLNIIWRLINEAIYTLDQLALLGNDILIKYNSQLIISDDIIIYNRLHSNFTQSIEQVTAAVRSDNMSTNIQENMLRSNIQLERILRQFLENDNLS